MITQMSMHKVNNYIKEILKLKLKASLIVCDGIDLCLLKSVDTFLYNFLSFLMLF